MRQLIIWQRLYRKAAEQIKFFGLTGNGTGNGSGGGWGLLLGSAQFCGAILLSRNSAQASDEPSIAASAGTTTL